MVGVVAVAAAVVVVVAAVGAVTAVGVVVAVAGNDILGETAAVGPHDDDD